MKNEVFIKTEMESVHYQTKNNQFETFEPVTYMIINGVKIKVASVITVLSNEKMLSPKEELNLNMRQSNSYLSKILIPHTDTIIDLLKLTF